jgi:hypothetical protein
VKILAVLSLTMGVAVFLVGAIVNHWKNIFYYIINAFLVIIIANVPQGEGMQEMLGRWDFDSLTIPARRRINFYRAAHRKPTERCL